MRCVALALNVSWLSGVGGPSGWSGEANPAVHPLAGAVRKCVAEMFRGELGKEKEYLVSWSSKREGTLQDGCWFSISFKMFC